MKTSIAISSSNLPSYGRRQPTRSTRTSSGRPSALNNRSSYQSAAPATAQQDPTQNPAPGFFPAITHFTDGLNALPKEVMRHFTLIKETEGKSHIHHQAIGDILDNINKLPNPPRRPSKPHQQPLLGLSLTHSLNGSASPSIADGSIPATQQSWQDGTMPTRSSTYFVDEQAEIRRTAFSKLRESLKSTLGVLDEKNMVLASANDALSRQLDRLDNVLPYVENEVSEEARLGSTTHWALAHMREARKATGTNANDRSRRDVQNANSLAAAAAAVHEGDIAATRSEARREALLAKRRANVDSDFDERPNKRAQTGAKSRKLQDASLNADGKAAGPPQKRRRVDKAAATAMERSTSGAATNKGAAAAQRERGSVEPARKRKNASNNLAKKRRLNGSGALASSPTRGTFATATTNKDVPSTTSAARANNPRGRQNSAASLKSSTQESTARNRPASAATSGKANPNTANLGTPDIRGVANVTGRSVPDARAAIKDVYPTADGNASVEQQGMHGALVIDHPQHSTHASLNREETEPADDADTTIHRTDAAAAPSGRSRGGSSRAAAAAKADTPVGEGAGAADQPSISNTAAHTMARSRSTRGANTNVRGSGTRGTHSPNTAGAAGSPRRSATNKRTANIYADSSRTSPASSIDDGAQAAAAAAATAAHGQSAARSNHGTTAAAAPTDVDEEEGVEINPEHDLDGMSSPGSDEPRYCICNGPSYGHMIGCDNEECPREWFHLACVGMTRLPGARTKWYCDECKELMRKKGGAGSSR